MQATQIWKTFIPYELYCNGQLLYRVRKYYCSRCCFFLEGTRVEAGSIWAGVPAKKVKDISPELFEVEVMQIANNYLKYSGWFK